MPSSYTRLAQICVAVSLVAALHFWYENVSPNFQTLALASYSRAVDSVLQQKNASSNATVASFPDGILAKLQDGQDIVVVMVGGSVATGAHTPKGLNGAYAARFVARLNAKYASKSTGRFRLYNMAHGCTHTFYSAVALPSLVPHNASIILWGHNENDVTYSDAGVGEMMSLFLHSAKLVCPHCILGFAYTMRFFPDNNHNFNIQWPIIWEETDKSDTRIFHANLGEYVRQHRITKAQYAKDGVHITEVNHDILGRLLMDAAVPVLEVSSRQRHKAITRAISRKYGQFHGLFKQATAIQSVCFDEPTLDGTAHAMVDTHFARDPKRKDYVKFIVLKPCPQKSVYTFQKKRSASFMLGLGLFGNYSLEIPGREVAKVQRPEYWQTCAHSRDWPLWNYHHFDGMRVDVQICARDKSAQLRYISFLELQ